jgi:hypothetical protein
MPMKNKFKLYTNILAVSADSKPAPRFIPAGAIVSTAATLSARSTTLIDVLWKGTRWRLFAVDLLERGERV